MVRKRKGSRQREEARQWQLDEAGPRPAKPTAKDVFPLKQTRAELEAREVAARFHMRFSPEIKAEVERIETKVRERRANTSSEAFDA